MRARKYFFTWGAGMLLLLATGGLAGASNSCFSAHSFGSGLAQFNICISNHGNFIRLISPAGFDQFSPDRREGYALCDQTGGGRYFDIGSSEGGFGNPLISQPNGRNTFPLTITRTTLDGRLRLQQGFAQNPTEREVKITMTLTNLTSTARSVRLSRIAKGDIDGDFGDDFAALTHDTVFQWEQAIGTRTHGLELTTLSPTTGHATFVQSFTATNDPCNHEAVSVPTPTAPGDFEGALRHFFALGAGVSKAVTILYRRF